MGYFGSLGALGGVAVPGVTYPWSQKLQLTLPSGYHWFQKPGIANLWILKADPIYVDPWTISTPAQPATPTQPGSSSPAQPEALLPGTTITETARKTNWLLIGGIGTAAIVGALLIFKKKKKGKERR